MTQEAMRHGVFSQDPGTDTVRPGYCSLWRVLHPQLGAHYFHHFLLVPFHWKVCGSQSASVGQQPPGDPTRKGKVQTGLRGRDQEAFPSTEPTGSMELLSIPLLNSGLIPQCT